MPTHSQLWLHHYQLEFLVIRVVECASRCRLTRKVPGKPNEAIWQTYHGTWEMVAGRWPRIGDASPCVLILGHQGCGGETPQRASWKGSKNLPNLSYSFVGVSKRSDCPSGPHPTVNKLDRLYLCRMGSQPAGLKLQKRLRNRGNWCLSNPAITRCRNIRNCWKPANIIHLATSHERYYGKSVVSEVILVSYIWLSRIWRGGNISLSLNHMFLVPKQPALGVPQSSHGIAS